MPALEVISKEAQVLFSLVKVDARRLSASAFAVVLFLKQTSEAVPANTKSRSA